MLKEFEGWLKKEWDYDSDNVLELLYKEWDGAYPTSLIGDDIIVDIENFLYNMAQFAVEKAFGKGVDCDRRFLIQIIPWGCCESDSSVYVLEMRTKTVLASLEEKTWRFSPELIEEDLEDLIEQLQRAKGLLAVRLAADS